MATATPPQRPNPSTSGKSSQSWSDWLLSIWPDHMAANGVAPPVGSPGVKVGNSAPVVPMDNSRYAVPIPQPGSSPFTNSQPSTLVDDQTKSTVIPAMHPKSQPAAPTDSSFFYGTSLPPATASETPPMPLTNDQLFGAAGDAISGVRAMQNPNVPYPNAPGIPGDRKSTRLNSSHG